MEEEDPQNDSKESTNCSHYSINIHTQPFFEEDGWADHDRGCEENIVDGSDNWGVKDVKGFVQVADLNANTDDQADD